MVILWFLIELSIQQNIDYGALGDLTDEQLTALYNGYSGLLSSAMYEDDFDDVINKIHNGDFDELLDDLLDINPEEPVIDSCLSKMACEEKLRSDLFSTYSPILKPTEMEFMDVTFVELNLVLDKVLEVSQTGEFMTGTGFYLRRHYF